MYPEVIVRKGKEGSIERMHPWIFSGAVQVGADAEDGSPVWVKDYKGNYLATGHYSEQGSIAIRVLEFGKVELNNAFWEAKFEKALALRSTLNLPNEMTTCYRLIHGEGDGIPGLIVDVYGKAAVLQCHAPGVYRAIDDIADAMKTVMPDLKVIYNKSQDTLHGYEVENEYLFGDDSFSEVVYEHGISYKLDWVKGQKTGFFLDQRDARYRLQKYAKGQKVLNTFSYSGGFSLNALAAGATLVKSVDVSQKAIDLVEENIAMNDFPGNHESVTADVMDYIKELDEDYDVIILDPPAFAKRRSHKHKAVQAYKRLNALALRQIKKGGII